MLPGGFVDMDENLDAAARWELEEETGLMGVDELIQVGAFDDLPWLAFDHDKIIDAGCRQVVT